ncbi:MAG: glycoside hydrolase family 97 protein, partial [Chitinophagaceae bacterium]
MNTRTLQLLIFFCIGWIPFQSIAQQTVTASKENISLSFQLDADGKPVHSVQYHQRDVIKASRLGFSLDVDSNFHSGFSLINSEKKQHDDTWHPVWGEESSIRNNYEELTIHLRHRSGRMLDIVFRVFADGVGFRYIFPMQPGLKYFIVQDEYTEFNLTGDHTAFWIPGDYDTNEYRYTNSKISAIDNRPVVAAATDIAVRVAPDPYSVQTPLMMKSADGLYINIHEAALINYPAMQLHTDAATLSLSARLVPDAVGNKAYLHAPAKTPWRTIIVSNKAADILASRMILNLNDPSAAEQTSWIKPMKFAGVWWEY